MIFQTAKSIYEVQERERRFRRIHESDAAHEHLPLGRWYRFQRISPIVVGEPVRFLWMLGEDGPLTRIGLWATGPVVAVMPESDPSFLIAADQHVRRATPVS
jgi:hypothetical protein